MQPPVFSQLTFAQAQATAATQGKWVLVDFSAEWCQPCKHMDRTTWIAPEVVEWVRANAIAIQLDGDASPLTKEWSVSAFPTLIMFDGEKELDRTSGARPAVALLQWFSELKSGRTELDRLRTTPREDLSGQLSLARMLVEKGFDDEALEIFAWLWEHCLEITPAWVGVRSSFLLGALAPLLERSASARARFTQFRETAAGGADPDSFSDFVTLNATLEDDERTLDWLRSASPQDAAAMQVQRNHRILDLIGERGEFALFGRLLSDPYPLLEAQQSIFEHIRDDAGFEEDEREQMLEQFSENRRNAASLLARSLRAVNREQDALGIEARLKELEAKS